VTGFSKLVAITALYLKLDTEGRVRAGQPAPVISGLLMQVAALQSALAARSIQLAVEPPPPEDRLLTVDEAAALLGVTVDWLRRRPRLPFRVQLAEGTVRYSAAGIGRYITCKLQEQGN
jgi:hypothetical protein